MLPISVSDRDVVSPDPVGGTKQTPQLVGSGGAAQNRVCCKDQGLELLLPVLQPRDRPDTDRREADGYPSLFHKAQHVQAVHFPF